MSRVSEIQAAIRELKADMKARGLPVRSMMNGGHTMESMRANERLFDLKIQLDQARGRKV